MKQPQVKQPHYNLRINLSRPTYISGYTKLRQGKIHFLPTTRCHVFYLKMYDDNERGMLITLCEN